jgi:hypothetical protein
MGVPIDQTRHDKRSTGVDDAATPEFQRDVFSMPHGCDIRAVNGHSAIGNDRIFFIHDQDDPAGNNEIHFSHLNRAPLPGFTGKSYHRARHSFKAYSFIRTKNH